tara:strand:+ start:4920 stop:5837 length:918 start_codon:yes stop_codon:yes gene_type:complete
MNSASNTSCKPAERQSGFSLVELMISVTLGLIVLAGVTSVFMGSRQSFRSQESIGHIQESGRFLNYVMYPTLRLAGYLPDPLTQVSPPDHFRGQWRQLFGSEDAFFTTAQVTGIANAVAGSDALLVTYAGSTTPLRSCLGEPVNEGQIVTNVFYVSSPGAGEPVGLNRLSCGTAFAPGTAPGPALQTPTVNPIAINRSEPLITGVQSMQILYGVDTNPGDDSPLPPAIPGLVANQYLPANAVADWQRVVSVRIDLTTVSEEQSEQGNVTGGDEGIDGTRVSDFVEGRRLQRVFSTTLLVRNRLRI